MRNSRKRFITQGKLILIAVALSLGVLSMMNKDTCEKERQAGFIHCSNF